MKNDLSKVKVGDWLWTIQAGWEQVIEVFDPDDSSFPIITDTQAYTLEGRSSSGHKYPSALLEPLAGFDAEPKPQKKVKMWQWLYRLNSGGIRATEGFYKSREDLEKHLFGKEIIQRLDYTEVEVEV